ncbi:MAG: hypothetical protein OXC41_06915 [Gammaproteobacteria bacterium]|nr:hypothetical protein [Gammaproteobacteria bacterium]
MGKRTKQDDPEQSKRFIEKAKELGCDTKPFEQTFKKVVKPKRKKH